jgi:hypothetical protein
LCAGQICKRKGIVFNELKMESQLGMVACACSLGLRVSPHFKQQPKQQNAKPNNM